MSSPATEPQQHLEPRRTAPAWRVVLPALLLLWSARGVLVLSQADVFGYEEFAKAELGSALDDGLGVAHFRLAYHYYEIGGFVFSHLCTLFFALLGPSVLTVKAVALAWHSAFLLLAMALAWTAYGRRGAIVAALLFALPAASLQKLSLLALGIHFESLLFHAWILLHAGRIAVDGSLRRRDLIGLGLACGLGASFNLTTLAASACAGLAVLVRARAVLSRGRWLWIVGAGLLGLAPWLYMASNVGAAVLDLHGETLGTGDGRSSTAARLGQFAGMLWNDRPWLDRADLLVRAGLFLWGLVWLLRGRERGAAWTRLFVAHLAIFVAASLASGLVVGRVSHYNEFARPSPTWLAIGLVTAGALARLSSASAPSGRRAACVALALLVGFGLRSVLVALGPVPPARWGESAAALQATRACALGECVVYLYDRLEGGPDERAAVLLRLRETSRARLEAQIGAAAIGRRLPGLEQALESARAMGGERWRNYALGLGDLVTHAIGWDATRLPQTLERFDPQTRDLFYEACARGPYQRLQLALLEEDVALGCRAGFPQAWFEGLGWRLAHLHIESARVPYHRIRPIHPGYDEAAAREFLARQPESVRDALERGWRRALADLRGVPPVDR
jgi:hypothetical protein